MLLSCAATGRTSSRGGKKVRVIDAKKAHLHAFAVRELYVELPPECRRPGWCGLLRRCLYGTRDAPSQWEKFMAAQLERMGFARGKASPSCFFHRIRDLRCVVHGDDFSFCGLEKDLDWATQRMEQLFLCKVVGTLGGDEHDMQELRVLNRVFRWENWGISYQADPRHLEILERDVLGNKQVLDITGAVGASATPGVKVKEEDEEEDLTTEMAHSFRSWSARCLYLSLDRPDVAFAAKELCRRMSAPTKSELNALVRVVKYMSNARWLVYRFPWQQSGSARLKTLTDTDFAGCQRTRKSTSGGMTMLGCHLIKHWASTQRVITLSSGEAEMGGIVKGATETMGIRSLATDLGIVSGTPEIHADASAAIGICRRAGIGKVRHLAVVQLWIQEEIRSKNLMLRKIDGARNCADLCTKHVPRAVLEKLLGYMPIKVVSERAQSAPLISV